MSAVVLALIGLGCVISARPGEVVTIRRWVISRDRIISLGFGIMIGAYILAAT